MPNDIAETVFFRDICVMLEKVKEGKNIASKEKYIRRYYESFKKHRAVFRRELNVPDGAEEKGDSSFYCILRCLIPGTDNGREAYGLQITTLGKVYVNVLQLAPDSPDAQRLYARSYSSVRGDYAEKVYAVLKPRCQIEASNLTLKQVHDMLDTIAEDDRRNTEKVLTRLSEVASAQEQKWFIRLLLKSMHLGIGEQRIFGTLHPQAMQIYRRCSSLARVCCLLADNKLTEATGNEGAGGDNALINQMVVPFEHIRPMLCEVFPGNIKSLMDADVLYLETKMDGERFHLHYTEGRFKYISRNGVDYTYSFGSSYESGSLTPHLRNLLPIDMQSIILDGEMMVYDTKSCKICPKGEGTDVKHLSGHYSPCFVIYDLLYLNGSSLLDLAYAKRIHKLKVLIKEQENVLQIMKPVKITSLDELKSLFQRALDNKEEGIVLKKQNSVYKPGVRHGGGWYKVKPDYIEGLTTEFDLLIMGGFYNRTRSFIESFLLGVLKYTSPQKFEVYSVAKVPNNIQQRVKLNEALKAHWHPLDREPPPIWYHYSVGSAEGRPDVWVQPRDSSILQIKAADLAPSAAFCLSKSLHFPRIEAWRNDKVWHECMTLNEFMDMCQGNRGLRKIHKRLLQLEDFTRIRKRPRLTPGQKRKLGLQAYEKKFDAGMISRDSELLAAFSFCILSGYAKNGYTPERLKQLAARNGAEIVENPLYHDPKCVVVAGDSTYRVETLKKSCRCNIVSVNWLLRICESQDMRLTPRDMVCITPELKAQFAELYDAYFDSYTDNVTTEELEEICASISDLQVANFDVSEAQIQALQDEINSVMVI